MLLITQKHLNSELRREQIVEATEKIILEGGGENLTVRQIAGEVGLSGGAIYRHFESKSDIFSFLLDDIEEALLGNFKRGLIPDGKVMDYLHDIFNKQVLATDRRRAVTLQIISEIISMGDVELNGQLKGIIDSYLNYVKNTLLLGIRTGEFRADIDLESAAMFFFGMTDSISRYSILTISPINLDEKARASWEIFRKMIATV